MLKFLKAVQQNLPITQPNIETNRKPYQIIAEPKLKYFAGGYLPNKLLYGGGALANNPLPNNNKDKERCKDTK